MRETTSQYIFNNKQASLTLKLEIDRKIDAAKPIEAFPSKAEQIRPIWLVIWRSRGVKGYWRGWRHEVGGERHTTTTASSTCESKQNSRLTLWNEMCRALLFLEMFISVFAWFAVFWFTCAGRSRICCIVSLTAGSSSFSSGCSP